MLGSSDIERFIKGEIALDIPKAGGKCYFEGKIFRTPISFVLYDALRYKETKISYIIDFFVKEYPIGSFLLPKDSTIDV